MLNQVILIGRVSRIKKVKGVITQFHLDIPRSHELEVDSPIIQINEGLSESIKDFVKDNTLLAVKGRIETVIRGGYGTVTSIVAERITYLTKKLDEDNPS